jgi:protein-tyrosine kinase
MSRFKKALEKAKEIRESEVPVDGTYEQQVNTDLISVSTEEEKTLPENGIHVEYIRTKIEPVDLAKLENNKIFALFPKNELTDQINMLRTQVLSKLKEVGGNSLLITSANPQEGKTFTTVNLGVSIAKELNRTVLIVDTDLKTPDGNHCDFAKDYFGISVQKGLSDYLIREAELPDIFINPGIEKLTILPGGRPVAHSSELLGSTRMAEMIKELKRRYREDRIVIFDSGSLLKSPDPLVFSDLIDCILLVVEMGRTTPEELKRTVDLLRDKPLIGTVMNKVKGGRNAHV